MSNDYFVGGEWNFICDECGRKEKSSKAKHRWDGLIVCPPCWEPRHPQDFVRGVEDDQSVPWSRPQGDNQFIKDIPGVTTAVVIVPDFNGVEGDTFTLGKVSRDSL